MRDDDDQFKRDGTGFSSCYLGVCVRALAQLGSRYAISGNMVWTWLDQLGKNSKINALESSGRPFASQSAASSIKTGAKWNSLTSSRPVTRSHLPLSLVRIMRPYATVAPKYSDCMLCGNLRSRGILPVHQSF